MQHKFPLCIFNISVDVSKVDVNVHPTKADVRFDDPDLVFRTVSGIIHDTLKANEMMPKPGFEDPKQHEREVIEERKSEMKVHIPEKFDVSVQESKPVSDFSFDFETREETGIKESSILDRFKESLSFDNAAAVEAEKVQNVHQMTFFSDEEIKNKNDEEAERTLSMRNRDKYRYIGQVFDTYILIEYEDKFLMIDQHAAHEKVKFERFMKRFNEKTMLTQQLLPPIVLSLTGQEETALSQYSDVFKRLGFEVESFGGNEYILSGVPIDLYGCGEKELFLNVLDELVNVGDRGSYKSIEEKIASMSCKAAIKGNNSLADEEVYELIDELLTLDNPYNCPHGRPTTIIFTKQEMDKKFKRIV